MTSESVTSPEPTTQGVRKLRDPAQILALLESGAALGLLLVQEDCGDPAIVALVERARAKGVPVRPASASVLRRMSSPLPPSPVLALHGRDPAASLDAVLELRGAVWLLLGVSYPTNAGVSIRTAEGSGATAVVIDAEWDHDARRAATRASMRADWYMPVFWERSRVVIARARERGYRIVALENTGVLAPWEVDLTPPTLFVVGGEAHGVPPEVLADCDDTLCIPMGGFIPSHNLQIALGVVGTERLRQLAAKR